MRLKMNPTAPRLLSVSNLGRRDLRGDVSTTRVKIRRIPNHVAVYSDMYWSDTAHTLLPLCACA